MSIREAWSLTVELVKDPSSRVYASISGWPYPMSRESFLLADLHDRFTAVNFKRPKPYPRPTDANKGRSKKPTVPQHVIKDALRALGHGLN